MIILCINSREFGRFADNYYLWAINIINELVHKIGACDVFKFLIKNRILIVQYLNLYLIRSFSYLMC